MNPDAQALLAQLRDIHTPGIGGFPIAPVWFLITLVSVIVVVILVSILKRRQQSRLQMIWRNQAMQELEQIRRQAANQPIADTAAACSRLLRRITLVALPRKSVAGLTGQDWLSILDRLHGSNEFSKTQATHLLETAYLDPGTTVSNPGNGSQVSQASQVKTPIRNSSPPEPSADSVMQPLLQLTEELIERVAHKVTRALGG